MSESYARTVTLRAWHQTMKFVVGETWQSRFVTFGAYVFTLYFAYLWLKYVDKNSTVYSDAQRAALLALGVGLSLFVFGFLLHVLWLIPAAIWREQSTTIRDMTVRLTPKFLVRVSEPQAPENVNYGHTSISMGGTLQTVSTRLNTIFKIDVENTSDVPLSGCEAYLSQFSDVENGTQPHWQSIRIPWLQIDGQVDGITIPSKGKRSISPFRILNNRTVFLTTEMPVPAMHSIRDKGEYRGLIVLTAVGSAATFVSFSLKCDAPENPPILVLTQEGQNA